MKQIERDYALLKECYEQLLLDHSNLKIQVKELRKQLNIKDNEN